jgi:nucleoside-triphosphatase
MNPDSMTRRAPRVVLLTGHPGVGKTTAICKIASDLGDSTVGGFYTEEIRHSGQRQGFSIVAFGGSRDVFAHVDFSKQYRVGKYGVDIERLESIAIPALALEPSKMFHLVDEIGKMECLSEGFITAMRRLLQSDRIVVATIADRGRGFIAEVKQRDDAVLREVTRENRDELPRRIAQWLNR